MKIGLAGFTGSGKSTVFHWLTGVTPDPGRAQQGQSGNAKIPDERLDWLSTKFKPKKTTPASIDFIDTPGLLIDERRDNPRRLAILRDTGGLVVVLNGFSGGDVAAELRRFREELLFADREKDNLVHGVINVPKDLVARGSSQTQIAHEDLAVLGAKLFQLQLQFRGCGQSLRRQLQQFSRQRLSDAGVADVDQCQLWLKRQELKTANGFLLIFLESKRGGRLAFLEDRHDPLKQSQLLEIGFPLLGRFGFLGLVLELGDAVGDDFQIGEEQLLAEAA